jgi:hypothetical protein
VFPLFLFVCDSQPVWLGDQGTPISMNLLIVRFL